MDESPLPVVGILCAGLVVLLAVIAWPADPTASPAAGAVPGSILLAVGMAVAFSVRRHGRLERRLGASLAAAGGMGIALTGSMAYIGGETAGAEPWAAAAIAFTGFLGVGIAAADHQGIAPTGLVAGSGFVFRGLALVFAGYVVAGVVFALLIDGPAAVGTPLPFLAEVALRPIALGIGFGIATMGFVVLTDRGRSYIDLRRPTKRDGYWVLGGTAAVLAAWLGLSGLFALLDIDVARHAVGREGDLIGGGVVLVAIAFTLFSVIGEELLFRNGLQKHLTERFPAWSAIAATSLVFAVGHLTAYSGIDGFAVAASLGVVFVLSVIIGIAYDRTESLIVPVAIHWFYNLIAYAIIYSQTAG